MTPYYALCTVQHLLSAMFTLAEQTVCGFDFFLDFCNRRFNFLRLLSKIYSSPPAAVIFAPSSCHIIAPRTLYKIFLHTHLLSFFSFFFFFIVIRSFIPVIWPSVNNAKLFAERLYRAGFNLHTVYVGLCASVRVYLYVYIYIQSQS